MVAMLIKLVPVVVVLVCLLSFVCTVLTNSESDCVSFPLRVVVVVLTPRMVFWLAPCFRGFC